MFNSESLWSDLPGLVGLAIDSLHNSGKLALRAVKVTNRAEEGV